MSCFGFATGGESIFNAKQRTILHFTCRLAGRSPNLYYILIQTIDLNSLIRAKEYSIYDSIQYFFSQLLLFRGNTSGFWMVIGDFLCFGIIWHSFLAYSIMKLS
jgi:hypothetical protein